MRTVDSLGYGLKWTDVTLQRTETGRAEDRGGGSRRLRLALWCLGGWLAAISGEAGDSALQASLAGGDPSAVPIPPYLYGQFIEHLGRCIHDGIWAEKLRDRKFLLEPGKSWEVTKPEGAQCEVFHDTAGAFAGEHCMAVWVRDSKGGKCGLAQAKIGLVAGKEYIGYVVAARVAGECPLELRLSWGEGSDASQAITLRELSREYKKWTFRFRAGATTDAATLAVTVNEPGYVWLGALSLMPADHIKGMRCDTLDLIRQLGPPITRWPGGNFVSGYNWKDGLGDRDRRPPRWERAWNDVEDNDFGIDEFLTFCQEVATEPYIAVNTGLGSVDDAAAEVEYVNGAPESRWGAVRARNGHLKPYGVVWWGVGNEMYGDWQLGHVPVERYAWRHNAFVAAMKGKDPSVRIIAVGAPGTWNDTVLPRCAGHMDLLSGHHYTERKFRLPFGPEDALAYEKAFPTYSESVAKGIRSIVADFRARLGQGNSEIDGVRLAIDEWGLVRDWNATPDAPGVGAFEHYYCLGDTVMLARGLHELLRASDVVAMANWAQTVNVIGVIKTSRTAAVMDPVGHLLSLYRAHIRGALTTAQVVGNAPLDTVTAWDRDRGKVAWGLVNYSPTQALTLVLKVDGLPEGQTCTVYRITGPSLGAINVPGQPETVTTLELPAPVILGKPFTLPRHSITVVETRWN